jgi:hypothetical protein
MNNYDLPHSEAYWRGELFEMLHEILRKEDKIMSAITDLQAAVDAETAAISDVTDAVTAEETLVQAQITALKTAQAGTPDAALAPIIAALQSHVAALGTIKGGLAGFTLV